MTTLSEALAPKSDQLNADDLIPGPRTLKITGGRIAKDGRQTRVILNFEGDQGKPFKPCKTMGRAMVMVWAITDENFEEQVKGKSIRVYRDPEVTFGDQGQIGGVRISHMSHIDKPAKVKLTVSQGKKSVFTFHPLVTDAPKADRVADGVRALIERIQAGEDVAVEPAVIKQRAWLAANRPDLSDELEKALAPAATEDDPFAEGPADSQRGDGFDVSADEIIGFMVKKITVIDVNSLVSSHKETIMGMSEEDRDRIADAQTKRIAEIKGGVA